MLIVYCDLLVPSLQRELVQIDPRVHYWPFSWQHDLGFNAAVPSSWWISFSSSKTGIIWLIHYGEFSRVVYRE